VVIKTIESKNYALNLSLSLSGKRWKKHTVAKSCKLSKF